MYLDFELCDRKQNVLTRLDNRRPGGYVELGVNSARRAKVPLSLEDPALALAKAVETVLRVTLHGPEIDGEPWSKVLFIGRVIIPEQTQTEEEEQIAINAIDPFFQLEKSLVRAASGTTWGWVTWTGLDQAQIMWALISLATTHGIVAGALPASIARTRTYIPGKEIGAAILEMTEVINGPDFELEPVVASDGTLCKFNTFYPHQGEDKSASVKFVCGAAPSTATQFIYAPGGDGMCNRAVVIGAPLNDESESEVPNPIATFPGYVAEDPASIAKYGAWEQVVQLEDVTQVATMQSHAEAIVSAAAVPIPYFDFTAAQEQVDGEVGDGIPPRFGIDYWLGDTVAVDYWAPGATEALEVKGRITDATVTEQESGAVAVKSSCSPAVKSEGITGKAITLLIPEVETGTEA